MLLTSMLLSQNVQHLFIEPKNYYDTQWSRNQHFAVAEPNVNCGYFSDLTISYLTCSR